MKRNKKKAVTFTSRRLRKATRAAVSKYLEPKDGDLPLDRKHLEQDIVFVDKFFPEKNQCLVRWRDKPDMAPFTVMIGASMMSDIARVTWCPATEPEIDEHTGRIAYVPDREIMGVVHAIHGDHDRRGSVLTRFIHMPGEADLEVYPGSYTMSYDKTFLHLRRDNSELFSPWVKFRNDDFRYFELKEDNINLVNNLTNLGLTSSAINMNTTTTNITSPTLGLTSDTVMNLTTPALNIGDDTTLTLNGDVINDTIMHMPTSVDLDAYDVVSIYAWDVNNLLTSNQATGTDTLQNTTGFNLYRTGTISSFYAGEGNSQQGSRSLRVQTNGNSYSGWYIDITLQPTTDYRLSLWIYGVRDGAAMKLEVRDANTSLAADNFYGDPRVLWQEEGVGFRTLNNTAIRIHVETMENYACGSGSDHYCFYTDEIMLNNGTFYLPWSDPASYNPNLEGLLLKADATTASKAAYGFVKQDYNAGDVAKIYTSGILPVPPYIGSYDMDSRKYYLDTTPGHITATAPTASGNLLQEVGTALNQEQLLFTADGLKVVRV